MVLQAEKTQLEAGQISYTLEGAKKTVSYYTKDCHDIKNVPRINDKVCFSSLYLDSIL